MRIKENGMIYTSYFGNRKLRNNPNLSLISIALYPPKDYRGKSYRALAPHPGVLRDWRRDHDEPNYIRDFNLMLEDLSQEVVVKDLMFLSGNFKNLNYLPDIVLLCYERPDEFCHRHLVANWLNAAGYKVEELT